MIGNDEFYIDNVFLEDKTLIILDDIKITGTHEIMIKRTLDQQSVTNDAYFVYFAELSNSNIHPKIESYLNNYTIKSINDLDKIVQRSRDVSAKLSGGISHLMKKNNVSVFNGYGKLMGMNAQSKLQQVSVSNNDKVEAQLSAKHIILATGARAKSFPGLEADGERVWSYKEALVPKKMPKSLLVIGSGAIGIEFANFYQTFGCDVTVVEAMDQIMPFEDKEIADIAQGAMKKRGMKFRLATKVVELERLKDQVTATIEKNGKTEQLTIEQVITAVGVIPNIENIGLSTAEVSLDQQGFIAVDDFCQTSAQGIYAIGDVAGAPCLAHKASHEAIICIEKIAEQKTVHALDKSMIPACTYGFPQVASIGLTEKKAKDQGFKVRTGKFPFQANGKAIAQGHLIDPCLVSIEYSIRR